MASSMDTLKSGRRAALLTLSVVYVSFVVLGISITLISVALPSIQGTFNAGDACRLEVVFGKHRRIPALKLPEWAAPRKRWHQGGPHVEQYNRLHRFAGP